MQAAVVVLIVWVRVLYPTVVSPPKHSFRSIQLVSTPVPVNHQPQPLRHLQQPASSRELDPPANVLRLPAAQPKPPVKADVDPAPTVSIAAKKN